MEARRAAVWQHQEGVVIADFTKRTSGQQAFVLGVKGRQVDEGGLEIRREPDVLAETVVLHTQGSLQHGGPADVGHVFQKGTAGCGAGQTRVTQLAGRIVW